ncbi:hypothetical protein [uncultured Sphingomonas sp.]|uniref:hypothetical protein n=1 Tax=uncultured Sphingomonas sp. TaxID=158754 RepID=UPI0025F3B1D4|nr:hypothetical protein [uncultured Sphingomonas sp.]
MTNNGASSSADPVMPIIQSDRTGAHRTLPSRASLSGKAIIRVVERQVMQRSLCN